MRCGDGLNEGMFSSGAEPSLMARWREQQETQTGGVRLKPNSSAFFAQSVRVSNELSDSIAGSPLWVYARHRQRTILCSSGRGRNSQRSGRLIFSLRTMPDLTPRATYSS
jgi:hypothetical protein